MASHEATGMDPENDIDMFHASEQVNGDGPRYAIETAHDEEHPSVKGRGKGKSRWQNGGRGSAQLREPAMSIAHRTLLVLYIPPRVSTGVPQFFRERSPPHPRG